MSINKKTFIFFAIVSAIIILVFLIYVKKRSVPTEQRLESILPFSNTDTETTDVTNKTRSEQSSNVKIKINSVQQPSYIANVKPDTQSLDNKRIGKFVSLEKFSVQKETNKQKDILKQIFEQQKTNQYDNYQIEYNPDFEEFISKTINQKDKSLKSFKDFKSYIISAVNNYRRESKNERFVFASKEFSIPEPQYIEHIRSIDPYLFSIFCIIKTNAGFTKFLLNKPDVNFIKVFKTLLYLTTEAADESRNKITGKQLEYIKEKIFEKKNQNLLQHKILGYYKICIDQLNNETSFEKVKGGLVDKAKLEHRINSYTNIDVVNTNTNLDEINLQNLLFGNKHNKIDGGYELTFPIFLNAPPFLCFALNKLRVHSVFQQKISLFSLEDGEARYNLTGFFGVEKQTTVFYRPFFKHKNKWQWFNDQNKNQSIEITADFKTLNNEDTQECIRFVIYSRIQ
ncbi:hypothetical protein CDIK_2452 [Cucumispora dikerogammari]|nr:hypothetical protein CDIK_2452 [Cucumispora dikerogammari]